MQSRATDPPALLLEEGELGPRPREAAWALPMGAAASHTGLMGQALLGSRAV